MKDSNSLFSKSNKEFLKAIEEAKAVLNTSGLSSKGFKAEPTTRQASKWRNKKGIVYKIATGGFNV